MPSPWRRDLSAGQRDALSWGLRLVPAPLLTRVGMLASPWGRLARGGLRNRATVMRGGLAAGLSMNPGRSNPEYALGTNEPSVQDALAELLFPGAVFYDVGANVGFLSVIGAHLVGPTGFVYAFEPDLDNAAVIRANLRRNALDHTMVVARAVGTRTQQSQLQRSAYSGGHATAEAEAPPDLVESIPVEIVSLDDFAAQSGVRPPDVIKVDVEGAELAVLAGMAELLADARPTVLIELDDGSQAGHDRKVAALVDGLAAAGYAGTRLADAYVSTAWFISHWVCRPLA